jgi:hypothetical protein
MGAAHRLVGSEALVAQLLRQGFGLGAEFRLEAVHLIAVAAQGLDNHVNCHLDAVHGQLPVYGADFTCASRTIVSLVRFQCQPKTNEEARERELITSVPAAEGKPPLLVFNPDKDDLRKQLLTHISRFIRVEKYHYLDK